MVWIGRDPKIIYLQPPSNELRHLPLDQVSQSPIQPALSHFQGWGIQNFPA